MYMMTKRRSERKVVQDPATSFQSSARGGAVTANFGRTHKCVLSPELQECMDRNEGGAAASTRGRYETATPQR